MSEREREGRKMERERTGSKERPTTCVRRGDMVKCNNARPRPKEAAREQERAMQVWSAIPRIPVSSAQHPLSELSEDLQVKLFRKIWGKASAVTWRCHVASRA